MSQWKKTSPWGNYLDPEQNHKDTKGKRRMKSVIDQVRAEYPQMGKHIGSKSLLTLLGHLNSN